MNNEEILKKAMEKAKSNGWDDRFPPSTSKWPANLWFQEYFSIIFDHDFAKAFWGEETYFSEWCSFCDYPNSGYSAKSWQFHLQQMVVKKDPTKYLEQFI